MFLARLASCWEYSGIRGASGLSIGIVNNLITQDLNTRLVEGQLLSEGKILRREGVLDLVSPIPNPEDIVDPA